MDPKYELIFQTFPLSSGFVLKNRILMAPMTNSSSNEDGSVTDEEIEYYRVRSGGVAAVITACAYVLPDGKGFPNAIGADRDELIPSLKKLASAIKGEGAKAILQIFHAGRMAIPDLLPDKQPVSASAVAAEREGAVTPREMTEADINKTIQAFSEATRRAIEAGFDGVEIHGANTYLIQQFFSPHSNRRNDKWGGTIEKRMAFPLAVIDAIQKAVKEHAKQPLIVGYRISPEERENPGITMEDTLRFVDALADQNLDYIHVSVRNFWAGSIRDKSDDHSRVIMIREHVGDRVPVIGVGNLYSPDDVIKALKTKVPLLAIGRELIMEPKWVEKIANGKQDEIRITLSLADQKQLVIPDPLWNMITGVPGWFPVED
ncbi:2,4-dienoyl-CoA reductase-like NADH-dependent reductase (Old Yellow Enzyme family) [Bacillus oleivorans]|uniref:2,4-dienoyl-CoA reductase-like NADH-dependent reductase (Old Yellow Enzyme family) n=1 Tax=Bacillus oleivorans TaxID=1448271 RepID=A0A285CY58_9BACI|nr:NADH-dependent flavin oxidoreductase [Bacillus oleivorans]SNX72492.1 2,4-dienoyl-CoA reductase-like NADH-dependent reductase (Old Yellow Enzyme family) [Bacillus oleivorans]